MSGGSRRSNRGSPSFSSTVLAFTSMVAARASKCDAIGGARWSRLAYCHREACAVGDRGLDELACARETCCFANYVLIQHRLHRVLSARAALTAGLACNAPNTETEAIVA